MKLPARDAYALDLRQLGWNIAASVIAAALIVWLGADYQYGVALGVVILVVLAAYLNRDRRRRQAALARILQEPSSSASAALALGFVLQGLRAGGSAQEAIDAISIVTHFRKYPHSALFTAPLELLRNPTSDRRPDAARLIEATIREMGVARVRVKEVLADYLRSVPPTATLVLYGYSSTVLDAIEIAAEDVVHPIWVVEDLQYGEASVAEHHLVSRRLQQLRRLHYIVTFQSFVAATGTQRADTVDLIDGRQALVTHGSGFVALIGCDASDDGGKCLIPGVTAGRTSETVKFVEQFRTEHLDGSRRLVVASESYKMIEACGEGRHTTFAPLSTPLWVRLMHWAGFAIPFRAREVSLLSIRDEVHMIASDRGICLAPFDDGSMRRLRGRWAARLASDVAPTGRQVDRPQDARSAGGDSAKGQLHMTIATSDLVKACRQLPPLAAPEVIARDDIDPALAERLVVLLREGFPEQKWTPELVEDRVLNPGTVQAAFLFSTDSRPIGVVTLHSTETASTARLHWLAVAPAARRHRYATALVAALASEAERRRFMRLILTTERDKTPAIAMYRGLGFVESSVLPNSP